LFSWFAQTNESLMTGHMLSPGIRSAWGYLIVLDIVSDSKPMLSQQEQSKKVERCALNVFIV